MKSRIFSSRDIKSNLKGQVWIPVFITIGFLMAFPVAALIMLDNWEGLALPHEEVFYMYRQLWRDGFVFSGMLIAFGAAFINAVNGFWYLYSASKVDFYHCLPVKRSTMFLQKAVTGLLYYLVPYIIMEFFAVCIGAMKGHFSLELMVLALKMLVLHLAVYLMIYFSVVLAICLTGNLLMGALFTAGIALYGPMLGALIKGLCKGFFETYAMSAKGIPDAVYWLSPGYLGLELAKRYYYTDDAAVLKLFAAVVAFAVFAAAASWRAYVKRPMEAAGKSVVYGFVKVIVEFLIVIPAALGIGLIFYALRGSTKGIAWWVFGFLFGLFLVHGMLQTIFELDFRKFFSHKIQLGIAGICVVVCALIFKLDLLGFDTYIPSYEKLAGIATGLENWAGSENVSLVTKKEDGTYENSYSDWDRLGWNLGNSSEIYEVLDKVRQNTIRDGYRLPVKYILKSGREVCRRYFVSRETVIELLKAGYNTGSLKENKYSFLQIENKYLKSISGGFADNMDYMLFQDDRKKLEALAEAYAKDVEEADADTLISQPCALLEFVYRDFPVNSRQNRREKESNYSSVYVYPEFKRTVAILKETGYPLSMEDTDIESVSIRFSHMSGTGIYYSDYIEIEDKEQIEELKACMIPYCFGTDWMELDDNLEGTAMVEGNRVASSVLFLKDKVPAFVYEQIKAQKEFEGDAYESVSEDTQVDYK